jgi:hypothetical protein
VENNPFQVASLASGGRRPGGVRGRRGERAGEPGGSGQETSPRVDSGPRLAVAMGENSGRRRKAEPRKRKWDRLVRAGGAWG